MRFYAFYVVFLLTHFTDLLNKGYDVETKKLQVKTKTADGAVSIFCAFLIDPSYTVLHHRT